MTGEGTISNGTYVDGDDQEIRAIEIETGEGDTVYVGTSNHHSVLLAAGYLFIDQTALTAIELEDLEEEYGSRGYNASNAHHDGWAERAALKVASLEMNTAPDAPRIGDELTINVTAQLESGIEATVTDDSTLEVNALGSIDENGTIRVEDSGEMTLAATFGGQTTNRTITVPAEETTDDGHNSDEDASPSGGIIGIATAIGGTAYWLSRQSEAD